ncbi:MAG: hypothetical protein PUI84_04265 [Bacteroidales bacterium]|nr:hypothetical protein [Bacteroidales bacterium]MDY3102732.1 hypothetical protein [Porphyromonas sp.]
MKKIIVLVEFADRDCFSKRYKVGEELVSFDEDRISKLAERGLVKIENDESNDDLPRIGATELIAIVNETTDVDALNEYLSAENEAKKPRSTVLKAIEDRISKLTEQTQE